MGNHILMVLASENFRDIEYIVPRAFFEQHNCEVTTVSSAKTSKGRFGYEVQNDLLLDDVEIDQYDGIYFVGGNGSLEYMDNNVAKSLAMQFKESGKAVGAICAAPRNFLKWGMLSGLNSTGFDGDGVFSTMAVEHGSKPHPEKTVVVDGGILTSNGPVAAEESALEFLKLLQQSKN